MISTEPRIVLEKEQDNSFSAFVTMEYFLDKLKLLNYETEFLKGIKLKPLHKYIFLITYILVY